MIFIGHKIIHDRVMIVLPAGEREEREPEGEIEAALE